MPRKPPIPKSRPRSKKKKSTMREQSPSRLKDAYGLGIGLGAAGYGIHTAIQEDKVRKPSPPRYPKRRTGDDPRVQQRKQQLARWAKYDLYKMQNINPQGLNDFEKKQRNKIIAESKKAIKDAIPPSKFAKTLTNVARVAPGTAVVLTLLDFLQGTPAGEGSAITGPGARKK